MSDEFFEIAFSGQIADGADLETVKNKIGMMFKADEERLAQLFSGRRVLVKRHVDAATAAKYRGAFEKAGAICELKSLSGQAEAAEPAAGAPSPAPSTSAEDYQSRYPESDQIPQALLTEPLGVRGESIQDLAAEVAPVGSPMLDQIKEVSEPVIDISDMDVAPVGSDLSEGDNEAPPPPPDTSGLTMAD